MKSLYKGFKPTKGKIFVHCMEKGERKSKGGIVVLDDNMKDVGIRPRWAQVCAYGDGVHDLEIGDWILIEHGRWSFGINLDLEGETHTVWQVDPECILLASSEQPNDLIFGDL